MVQLVFGGVLIKDGIEVLSGGEIQSEQINEAKKNTIAFNILSSHNSVENNEALKIKFDAMASHDITYVGIIQIAKASGMTSFPIPYVLTNCHNSLCAVGGGTINEDDHLFGLAAAKKIWWYLCACPPRCYSPVYA